MKKFSKKVLFLMLAAVLVFASVAVYAKNENVTLEVAYRNIKLIVKGKEVQFGKDLQGNTIEPFIYEGVTYLPVRAVAEALGENVEWDQDNFTVIVGGEPKENPAPKPSGDAKKFFEVVKAYDSRNVEFGKYNLAGNKYENAMRTKGTYNYEKYAIFNLEGKYSLLTGIVGIDTRNENTATIQFIGDDKVIQEFVIQGGNLPKDFAVNVANVHKLEIKTIPNDSGVSYLNAVFAEMMIK